MKVLLVAFNGELLCFAHVLLNALDMHRRGMTPRIVFEGMSVKLVPELEKAENPFHAQYVEAREKELMEGVCKACSNKMGVLDAVRASGLPLLDNMNGHPALGAYTVEGWTILTF